MGATRWAFFPKSVTFCVNYRSIINAGYHEGSGRGGGERAIVTRLGIWETKEDLYNHSVSLYSHCMCMQQCVAHDKLASRQNRKYTEHIMKLPREYPGQ